MLLYGLDPNDLSQTGWGVVFAAEADPAIHEALAPLLEARRAQANGLYREFAVRPSEGRREFLARYGAGPGPVDPERVSYYLLLVGSPAQIPLDFQRGLAVQRAVGRLDLPTPGDYAAYAQSVVRAERNWQLQRAAFFGPQHPGDAHTAILGGEFLQPLAGRLQSQGQWEVELVAGDLARKEWLLSLLQESSHPALVLLAGHGLSFPPGDERQRADHGALVCQGWPGPQHAGPLDPGWYFSAADVPPQAEMTGTIWVQFSSFSAGTDQPDPAAVPEPFTARLAQRLLALPAGGVLAVVGLAGPMWGYASAGELSAATNLAAFEQALNQLARGAPVGSAFEPMRLRYAELTTDLSTMRDEISFGLTPDNQRLIDLWTARNDAGNLIILGDPAARLTTARTENVLVQQSAMSKGGAKLSFFNTLRGAGEALTRTLGGPEREAPGLRAELRVRLARLPGGLWPHLAPDQHPLASLTVANDGYERTAHARITAEIEGYSQTLTLEAEIDPLSQGDLDLLPPPFPDALERLRKPTWANLRVQVQEAETGQVALDDTRQIWLMETETFPLGVRDLGTGKADWQDFSLYLSRYITPDDPAVQQVLSVAAGFHRDGRLPGVDGEVLPQVRALLQALQRMQLKPAGDIDLKRTSDSVTVPAPRLPAQALASGEANSLEFALLFASLLHAARLNAVVFISEAFTGPGWTDGAGGYLQLHHLVSEDFDARARGAAEAARAARRKRVRPGEYPAFVQVELAQMFQAGLLR